MRSHSKVADLAEKPAATRMERVLRTFFWRGAFFISLHNDGRVSRAVIANLNSELVNFLTRGKDQTVEPDRYIIRGLF
jgi:hypothetical protein